MNVKKIDEKHLEEAILNEKTQMLLGIEMIKDGKLMIAVAKDRLNKIAEQQSDIQR